MKLRFTKMQGAGNDFVVLDGTRAPVTLTDEQVRMLGDRRYGVGADQILMIAPSPAPGVDFGYRIFNGGSGDEVEHCGNGARCFVRYVHDKGLSDKRVLRVQTVNNTLELHLQDDGRVTVDMNVPIFDLARVPFDSSGLTPRMVDGFAVWPLDVHGAPMSLLERIPTLSDEEVANLLENARRLLEHGDEKQRVAAEGLLPALEEADAERRQARLERAKEKRAATRRATQRAAQTQQAAA